MSRPTLVSTLGIATLWALIAATIPVGANALAGEYDLVLKNGRVMDPESGLDARRHVGISGGRIAAVSERQLSGKLELDVSGLVVAPGFIDFHAHGQREFEAGLQAQDGVTTQLDLEIGVYPVAAWYRSREGNAPINYGATVGHVPVRQMVFSGLTEEEMSDPATGQTMLSQRHWVDSEATDEQLLLIEQYIQRGLDDGGLGIGYGINYTAGATREEILRLFHVAKKNDVINFAHSRSMAQREPGGTVDATLELIADAAISGAGLHIVHIGSSGGKKTRLLLEMIDGARRNGLDITTEVYPYTAYTTFIGAAIFDGDFSRAQGIDYGDIELQATGERLDKERFDRIRRDEPNTMVVVHAMREADVAMAVAHPGVVIASDGLMFVDGIGHPRGAGTYARVLGRYVREKKALGLMEALAKMSYLPAKRLESSVPQMKGKGRIRVGADADIVVFDADTVADRATFRAPTLPSTGIRHVLVNGTFVVRDGELQKGVYPGRPIRR
ncbi:MAG TPA: amidohydrolase family protein [Woeseiaceae bacterium]|nr:amidohydrolase family protein [Woeseiaceae bacterium]